MTGSGDGNTDWNELWQLFHEALELDGDRRAALVQRVEGERRRQLEKMLAAHASVDEAKLPNLDELLDVDTSTETVDEPGPGDQIGHYRIKQRIGSGGMGHVYLATQEEPVKREVALKVLLFGSATRDIAARFGAERQALALMSHSNIAKVFDAGITDAGHPFFVMEYVPGAAITDYCDSRKLDIDARLRLFLDVCGGVVHAHQKGIIHRDLKPSNIIVAEEDARPVPKIIDFGIAKATEQKLGDESLYTRVGTFIGTPGYMSPEQAGVVPLDVDVRADVYSLGVLLYELLVGLQPYAETSSAGGLLQIQEAIRDEEPQRPSRRLSGVSADTRSEISVNRATRFPVLERRLHSDIEWIMLKALDKNRERRYSAVAEFAADIDRYLAGMPVLARAPTRRYRAAKFVKRHAVGVSVAAAIAVLILAFAAVMTVQSVRLQRALEQTTLERNRAEQVSDFMVELFESANPEISGRSDVTAAEILASGAERLQEDLANQPDLRARLLTTIGESYRVLGGPENVQTAIALIEQALTDLQALDAMPEQFAFAYQALAAVHHEAGDYDQAESNYLRAYDLVANGDDSLLLADVLGNLSVLNTNRGDLPVAEQYGRNAIDMQTRLSGPRDSKVARLKQRVAFILHQQGKSTEARSMMLDSLDVIREDYGASHPNVATALNYAAIIQGGAGDHRGAQQSLREAIEIYRASHGDDHPYLATTLNNLGLQYNRSGDFDLAVEALTDAVDVGATSWGFDHPNVNSYRINLGTTLQDIGRLVEAAPILQEGLVQDRVVLASGSPYLLATLDRLGATLARLGRYDEAEPLLREAVTMRREHRGTEDAETGVAVVNLAMIRLAQGETDEADALAKESAAIQRSLGEASDPLAQALVGIAIVRAAQGRDDEALDLFDQARQMFGPATKKTVMSQVDAGRVHAEIEILHGNTDVAREILLQTETTLQQFAPSGHPDLLQIRIALAVVDCQFGDRNELVSEIRAARPLLAAAVGEDNAELNDVELAVEQCLDYSAPSN